MGLGQELRLLEVHLGAINLAIEGVVEAQLRHVHRTRRNKFLEGGACGIFR